MIAICDYALGHATKISECRCDNKTLDGFGNCETTFSHHGRSGPICYVPKENMCSRSFKGRNGWYSWDPCPYFNPYLPRMYKIVNPSIAVLMQLPAKMFISNDDSLTYFIECKDDPDWRDYRYGVKNHTCLDVTLKWCNEYGNYSEEVKHACPESCGICKGNFYDSKYH